MLLIIGTFFIIIFWLQPWPQPPEIGLGLVALASASRFWPRLTSLDALISPSLSALNCQHCRCSTQPTDHLCDCSSTTTASDARNRIRCGSLLAAAPFGLLGSVTPAPVLPTDVVVDSTGAVSTCPRPTTTTAVAADVVALPHTRRRIGVVVS